MQINRTMRYVATLILAAAAMAACKKDSDSWNVPYKYSVTVANNIIGYNQTSNIISTLGDISSTLIAQIDGSTAEWCSFDRNGQLNSISAKPGNDFTIYTQVNDSGRERTATITVTFANGSVMTATFTQLAKGDNSDYERYWGEQPEMNDSNPNFIHKTYYATVNGKKYRNYSVCFDKDYKVSRWVAYPVHSFYTEGSNGRSNAWAFDDAVTTTGSNPYNGGSYSFISKYVSSIDAYDTYTLPIIEQKYQQNIVPGAYNDNNYPENRQYNLNRGHMLPSYSRQITWDINAQTFYATNMMPQNGDLNQNSWVNLEDKVRDNKCNDTLYVVVGTLFEEANGAKRINARERENIFMPSHCFKLMLRTKSGKTGKRIDEITDPDDLICIGFLYENNASAKNKTFSQAAMSVAELEERSGFKFFRMINPEIADEVKSKFDLSEWK